MEDLDKNNKKFITTKEAGTILGYTNDYVSKMCREGKIKSKRQGRKWLVDSSDLNSFQKNHNKEIEKNTRKLSTQMKKVAKTTKQTSAGKFTPTNILITAGATYVLLLSVFSAADAQINNFKNFSSDIVAFAENTGSDIYDATDYYLDKNFLFNTSLNSASMKSSDERLVNNRVPSGSSRPTN